MAVSFQLVVAVAVDVAIGAVVPAEAEPIEAVVPADGDRGD